MYLSLETATSHNKQAQPKMREGVWLGILERTEETIIGTERGTVKCRTVNRFPEDRRWDPEMINQLRGFPWATVNDAKGDHIPVEINEDGVPTTPVQENEDCEAEIQFEEDVDMPKRPNGLSNKEMGAAEFHIRKPVIQKYRYAKDCPACQRMHNIARQGGNMFGRLGTNHSKECRERIVEAMMQDPIDRHIAEAYRKMAEKQSEKGEGHGSVRITKSHDGKTCKEQDLENYMCKITTIGMDVAEIYSPERVTKMAREIGLSAGWAMDITNVDEYGEPWDFDELHMRNKAVRRVIRDRPMLFIGSLMCTEFCIWMAINHKLMPPEVVAERLRKAKQHLRFCTQLYKLQLDAGRYFLHEHPAGATSWKEQCVQRIL